MLRSLTSEYHRGMWQLERTDFEQRRKILAQDRSEFVRGQEQQVVSFVETVREKSSFFKSWLSGVEKISDLSQFANVPLLNKSDLVGEDG